MDSNPKSTLSWKVATLGVVYGDIGTSPLYALKATLLMGGLEVNLFNTLGVISLFIWVLILIGLYKYVHIVLHFDNRGEGGILALSALCNKIPFFKNKLVITILGLLGASLFFGDGVITPAISVLGAVEGLNVYSDNMHSYVLPLALCILVILFAMQSYGSGALGSYFGLVMLVWFLTLFVTGISQVAQSPWILKAINPWFGLNLVSSNPATGVIVLGGVILVVTGAEALYADMGHFGRRAIEKTWIFIVMPSLVINYLGQGALIINSPKLIENPFYNLFPEYLLLPAILLATISTVIASQSIISGVFSMTWQAIMLGYLPRMTVRHTSSDSMGQVYIPTINIFLLLACIFAILHFRSTDNLAHAYGLSVAGMMFITSILMIITLRYRHDWSWLKITLIFGVILVLDFIFTISNLLKIMHGGWFTVLIALIAFYVMYTWFIGIKYLNKPDKLSKVKLQELLRIERRKYFQKIPGAAIFLSRDLNSVPYSFLIHLKHNKYIHEDVVFLSFISSFKSKISSRKRFVLQKIDTGVYSLCVNIGFMEVPNASRAIQYLRKKNIIKNEEEVSFFLSRGVPVAHHGRLGFFSEQLYIFMAKNAMPAHEFFNIPESALVELGVRYRV
jgi:KUP system potassium uptake protein